ncbi:Olfactory receptor 10Q1 [Heterocephalus glaber]|nr:Olfactory receptor 10Q1 [Heterocephalus glaber]
MTQRLCLQMVAGSVGLALFLSLQLTSLIFSLPFCGRHREINHFLCDVPLVLRLACADIRVQQAVLYVVGILVLTVPFLLICVSYGFITAAILRISSSEGRQRACSTCSSGLTAVLLQYSCCSLVYLQPRSSTLEDEDRHTALIHTFVTPLLNPLIYTLQNKDVEGALRGAMVSKGSLRPAAGPGRLVGSVWLCPAQRLYTTSRITLSTVPTSRVLFFVPWCLRPTD